MKVQYVIDALKAGKNKFTVSQLTDIIRADAGDAALARRTRRALFVARKAGIVLEPIRDGGKAVTAYQLQGSIPEVAVAAPRKASKARTKTVTAKTISKEVAAVVAKNKAPTKKVAKVKVDTEAVKAKNLATIKAVHAKVTQDVHPVTKRKLTAEQKAVLEEHAQNERDAELEALRAEERADLRANAPAFLFKESYSE
jgi:hypothetical protein